MIERTVTVKDLEWLPTKDGKKQYMSVALTDGTKDSKQAVFDVAIQKTIQEAKDTDSSLLVKLEKEGNFWNIKAAAITAIPKTFQEAKAAPKSEPKTEWKGRTEDGMDRRTALMQAVEMYKHVVAGQLPFDDDVFDGVFVHFLKLLNPVIAEALKEGAKMQ